MKISRFLIATVVALAFFLGRETSLAQSTNTNVFVYVYDESGDTTDPPPCPIDSDSMMCPPEECAPTDDDDPDCSNGMATWRISEPFITLWVNDTPLAYTPGRGIPVQFKLSFRQRSSEPPNNGFSCGTNWGINWRNYILDNNGGDTTQRPGPGGTEYHYPVPLGSSGTSPVNKRSRSSMTRQTNTLGQASGYTINHASGAKDVYGYSAPLFSGTKTAWFITQQTDPFGNSTTYSYTTNLTSVLLSSVTDADGRVTTLTYGNTNFPRNITAITDPYGRQATLLYSTNGQLASITDVIGITSSFTYDGSNWVTSVTTPYGRTSFQYYNASYNGSAFGGTNEVNRAITVTLPTGSRELYMFRDNSLGLNHTDTNTPVFYPTTPPSALPGSAPTPTFDTNYFYRNSFHWGPEQFKLLNSTFQSGGDFLTLTTDDYNLARIRHWALQQQSTNILTPLFQMAPPGILDIVYGVIATVESVVIAPIGDILHLVIPILYDIPEVVPFLPPNQLSPTILFERKPTTGPDENAFTFYDYVDQPDTRYEGSSTLPRFVAKYSPLGGDILYTYTQRNNLFYPTNVQSSYSPDHSGSASVRVTTFEYASNGIDLLKEIGPNNETNKFTYNSNHQKLTWTNPLDEVNTYVYDTSHRLITNSTPAGLDISFEYFTSGANNGRLKKIIRSGISTQSLDYAYSSGGYAVTNTDVLGSVSVHYFDPLDKPTGVYFNGDSTSTTNLYTIPGGGTLPNGNGSKLLNVTATKDRLGNYTYFTYNGLRRVTSITNALTKVTIFTYCDCGALESITDAVGKTKTFYRDFLSRITNIVYADGSFQDRTYDARNRLTSIADGEGNTWEFQYTIQDTLSRIFQGGQDLDLATYDNRDRVTSHTDSRSVTIDMTYDKLNRLLSRTWPDTGEEDFFYNAHGLARYTNQLGNVTKFTYDDTLRLTGRTNDLGDSVSFTYDAGDNLLTLIDENSNKTTWKYNEFGWVTNKVDATTNTLFEFKYNANGWLTNRYTPVSSDTKYKYDAVGNLTNIDYTTSTDITFKYDAVNRLTNMTDAAGTTIFSYTAFGALASEDGPFSQDTVSYTYNTNRMRSGLSILQANGHTMAQSYIYDNLHRLTNTTSWAGAFSLDYDASGPLITNITHPSGSYISQIFDINARLTNTTLYTSSGTALNSHEYTFNKGNLRTKQTRKDGSTVDYTYDTIDQLLTAVGKQGAANRWNEQFTYKYDAGHNLTNRANNALTQAYSVNTLNELTSVANTGTITVSGTTTSIATNVSVASATQTNAASLYNDATFAATNFTRPNGTATYTATAKTTNRTDTTSVTVNLPNSVSYTYDSNGNLTYDGNRAFAFDDENQLIRVTVTNSWKSEFTYDGLRRKKFAKEYTWFSSAWVETNEVQYIHDGMLVIQERQFDPRISSSSPQTVVTYTRGPDFSSTLHGAGGIGGLLARSEANSVSIRHDFYHQEGNGNVTAMVNDKNALSAKYIYDPYGNLLAKSGPVADRNAYRFSSKEFHANSGLIYYGARFYDPGLQRWLSRDHLGELGGANLFLFVNNGPTFNIDFEGFWPTGKLGSENVHGNSINRVLPFLPQADLKILRDQQVDADKDQSAEGSFKHAMRDCKNKQSPNAARDLANQYVRLKLQIARCLEKQGRHSEALEALGDAMHALQDSTSPEHNGFKGWSGNSVGMEALSHGLGENFDPGAGSNLDRATSDAYKYFTGELPMPDNFFGYSPDLPNSSGYFPNMFEFW